MNSHLTQQELDQLLIDDAIAGVTAPPLYRSVSQTQMSIAKHYGCVNVNGLIYTYLPASDELIRSDALEALDAARRAGATIAAALADAQIEIAA